MIEEIASPCDREIASPCDREIASPDFSYSVTDYIRILKLRCLLTDPLWQTFISSKIVHQVENSISWAPSILDELFDKQTFGFVL